MTGAPTTKDSGVSSRQTSPAAPQVARQPVIGGGPPTAAQRLSAVSDQGAVGTENADGLQLPILLDERFDDRTALGDVLEKQSEVHRLTQPPRSIERDDRDPRVVESAQDVAEFRLVEQHGKRDRHGEGAQKCKVQLDEQLHAANTPWRFRL